MHKGELTVEMPRWRSIFYTRRMRKLAMKLTYEVEVPTVLTITKNPKTTEFAYRFAANDDIQYRRVHRWFEIHFGQFIEEEKSV